MLKIPSLISAIFILTSTQLLAADTKSKTITADDIRCEKLMATPLADFKAALVENCNLNKPYSTSLSRVLNDEVYFYCCHKK